MPPRTYMHKQHTNVYSQASVNTNEAYPQCLDFLVFVAEVSLALPQICLQQCYHSSVLVKLHGHGLNVCTFVYVYACVCLCVCVCVYVCCAMLYHSSVLVKLHEHGLNVCTFVYVYACICTHICGCGCYAILSLFSSHTSSTTIA